jgi:3-oxocholest-4-en-26-oyl-CoA dehydrogenase alpha subunit
MDFGLSPEQEAFRNEVRSFFAGALDTTVRAEMAEQGNEHSPTLHRRLAERGWLGLGWPREVGGAGMSPLELAIFMDESHYAGAPITGAMVSSIVGNALIHLAPDEVRAEFLGRVARGELLFCLGYTEPDAGSDLAALKTRAVRDGDQYVVNGSKIFTTNAHLADYMLLAARTDPVAAKHKGISLFLMAMDQPGISISPIHTMGGVRVNAVFLEDVRVPVRLRLGEENSGWYGLAVALDIERAATGFVGTARRVYDETTAWLLAPERDHLVDDRVARTMGRLGMELEAATLLAYRVPWMQAQGAVPTIESSVAKLYSTELAQRVANSCMDACGPHGQLTPEDRDPPAGGIAEQVHRSAVVLTIAGGSSEIQRNIIATRGLGLPRGA